MLPRHVFRTIFIIALVSLGLVWPLGGTPAEAHDEVMPGFEMKFPQDPVETEFADTWGARRSRGRTHQGTDLIADKMTAVYALADGVVSSITEGASSGRHLVITHADGWVSHYMHLNNDTPGTDDGQAPWWLTLAPGIWEGAEVRVGQLVAWVGDSGNADNDISHTHFELHHDGAKVNPYPLLVQLWEADLTTIANRQFAFDVTAMGRIQIF